MNLKWKVCGMKEADNIARVLNLEPDYMGFIFYRKSPRYVGEDWAGPGNGFPGSTKKVGVFVNEEMDRVVELAAKYQLEYLQLHGHETPDYCRLLSQQGLAVIKVTNPANLKEVKRLDQFKPWVEFFLFDTPGKQFGGTGKSFDWSLLEHYDNQVPVFLSGGISLENVQKVAELTRLNLSAVDVNSCFETRPGFKDVTKLKELKNKLLQL